MKKQHQDWGKKGNNSNLSYQRVLTNELYYFKSFLMNYPRYIQQQFVPYLEFIKVDPLLNQNLKDKVTALEKQLCDKRCVPSDFSEARNLLKVYQKMTQTVCHHKLIELFTKCEQKIKMLEENQDAKAKYMKKVAEYYPQKIQKTDALSKQYETSYRLSKLFGTHNLTHHDRKAKQPVFQINQRFTYRLDEILHYQSDAQQLGNILCLTYQGTKISGNKGYAVIDGTSIQWWQKKVQQAPEINLVTQNDEQNKDNKDKEAIQEKQNMGSKQPRTSDQRFKLNHVFLGHSQKITSLSVSYDQLYIISTGVDKSIKLWCLRLKTLLAQYYGHMSTVWSVEFAPTGYYFASGGADNNAIIWKTDVPTPQRIFPHKGEVSKVSFLKNSDFLATAGEEGIFRVWKIMTAECIRQICFPQEILNFNISFSGAYLGLYQLGGQISIYDLSKGQKINSFNILEGEHTTSFESSQSKPMKPHDICFSEDQKQFCAVTEKHIMLYSMDSLTEKMQKNIYDSESKVEKKQPPKEIVYMGRDMNLTYCSYSRKHILVVAGTKKN